MRKVLYYDIETSPLLSYVWEMYEANTLATEKERELMSFAYKWQGDNKIRVESLRTNTEKELVKKLHKLFDEADIIVGHNSDNFDNKMANTFFLKQGLLPPSPYQTIDTLKIARNKFRFASNHLNDLGQYLGVGKKVETGGFNLWLKCIKGDKKAWKLMEKYNKQDVELLEKVYNKLSSWVKTPFKDFGMVCQNCGSSHLQSRGWQIGQVYMSRRYQCQNCGKWQTSSLKIKHENGEYVR